MAGTKAGAAKAAATNKARHGADFYARIGKKGGQNGRTGGFFANRDLARVAGAKGGRISRRGPAKGKKVVITDQSQTTTVTVNQ
jgi:general stress protein YciG